MAATFYARWLAGVIADLCVKGRRPYRVWYEVNRLNERSDERTNERMTTAITTILGILISVFHH